MVHQANKSELIPGSIADTIARLLLWSQRCSRSLARVEFSSEFSRQKVIRELRNQFKEKEIPFHEIKLPLLENPSVVFNFLFKELENIASGVVSISGFETAFVKEIPLVEALRVINFNRENLAQFNLRQIWWMSRPFHSTAIRVMPDLNSWFSLRLFLTEDTLNIFNVFSGHGFYGNGDNVVGDKINVLSNHNLPNRGSREFIGRERELQQIHDFLNEDNQYTMIALSGMGGVGKTELALQYAWREWDNKTFLGGICWLNALNNDPGIQIVDFASQYLKLMLPDQGTLTERVRYCWQHWIEGDVLIIFDDVRDYEQIQPYLPPKQDKRFKVLITTRFHYLSQAIHTINLGLLTAEEGLKLLEIYLGNERIDAELEQAKELCQDLGYLPLGLELVARLLKQRQDWKISKIRQKLAEKGLDEPILAKNPKFDTEMTGERGVKAAFNLSWEELNSEPEAQILALYLSLFALAPFPKGMILDLFPDEDGDTVEEWLTDSLVHLSLVKDTGDGWYEIHTLLRRYFRDKLEASSHAEPAKRRYCIIMAKKSAEMPQNPTLKKVEEFTPFIPHLQASVGEYSEYIADEDLVSSYTGLASYYQGQGLYAIAEPYCQACLTATRTHLGDNHPHVATSLNNLAALYESQGRYTEAEPLLLEALDLTKRLLGDNHPDVATSLNNLAVLYCSQGRYKEAEPLHLEALDLRKRLLGDNHPDVAASLNNLAYLYYSQGRYKEAEPLYLEALDLCKRLLGDNHPHVATSLNNLAVLYCSQGRYKEAEPLHLEALDLRKRLLGDNHPDVAASLNNLAYLYYSQGRYEEAEPLYLEAINIFRERLGENHPHTQTFYQNYLEMLSQLPEAELRQRFPDEVVEMLKPKPPHP